MIGEELTLEELPYSAPELAMAMSNVLAGRRVYITGWGKTALLRALATSLYKAGLNPLYVKLEWIKYNWGVKEYIEHYYDKHYKITGYPAPREFDVSLIDDAELAAQYPNAYAKILVELKDKAKAIATRDEAYYYLEQIFGDGIHIRLEGTKNARIKLPLGLASIGRMVEIEII